MGTNPKAFNAGSEEARRDIAGGKLHLHHGIIADWGKDLQATLKNKFGIEVIDRSCFVTDESNSFVAGYNEIVTAHIDSIFGAGSVDSALQEVQQRRKQRYDARVASQKAV